MSKLEKGLKEWLALCIIHPDQAQRIRDHEAGLVALSLAEMNGSFRGLTDGTMSVLEESIAHKVMLIASSDYASICINQLFLMG